MTPEAPTPLETDWVPTTKRVNRELAEQVASLLGFRLETEGEYEEWWVSPTHGKFSYDGGGPPPFSARIEDAWKCIDAWVEEDLMTRRASVFRNVSPSDSHDKAWVCHIGAGAKATADTPSEAICLAFVEARGNR